MRFDKPDYEQLSMALSGTPVTVFFQDRDGHFVWLQNAQSVWANTDLTGKTPLEVFEAKSVERLERTQQRVRETGEPQTVELVALDGDDKRSASLKVTVRCRDDEDGNLAGYLCSCIDISDEKAREQTLKHLLREVAHRSKNMLAMVLSISSQTARVSKTIDGFTRAFTGRLQSMAKSQNVITDSDWEGARFRELVEQQVLNVVMLGGSRISVTGENPLLTPNAALHVGLALHELVTNALIHGSLSLPEGQIDLDCRVVSEDGMTPELVITWCESPLQHHPEDDASGRKFGKTMLERIVPSAINGTGKLEFSDNEACYTLTAASTEFR